MALGTTLTVMGWLGNSTGWVASGSQAVKTSRSGTVATLSYSSFIIGWIGDLLWLANGIAVKSLQGMVSPVLPLAATLIIIYLFGRARGKSKIDAVKFPAIMFVSYMTLFIIGVLNLYSWGWVAPAWLTFGIAIAATASWMVASPLQVYRIMKVKSGRDVSLYMAGLTILAQVFWVSYFGIRAWQYSTGTVLMDNGIANTIHLQDFLVSMVSGLFQICMYSIMVIAKLVFAKRNGEVIVGFFSKKNTNVELPSIAPAVAQEAVAVASAANAVVHVENPIQGKVIPLEKLKDGAFSKNYVGQGVAVTIDQGLEEFDVESPIDGTISFVHDLGHTLGIKDKKGRAILLHLGTDKINPNTNMFKTFVKAGDSVKVGKKLINVNLKDSGRKEIIEHLIIVNTSKNKVADIQDKKSVAQGKLLFTLSS